MTSPGPDVARLVGAAQQWLNEAAEGAHGGLDTGTAECGVCPLCRLVATLRTADPAVVETVVEVATTALVTVADVLREAGDRLMATVPSAAAPRPPAPEAADEATHGSDGEAFESAADEGSGAEATG